MNVIPDWAMPGYLQRNYKISLHENPETPVAYELSKVKTNKTASELKNCVINKR